MQFKIYYNIKKVFSRIYFNFNNNELISYFISTHKVSV